MDRGGWLWRRKSSDKNPCETESSGSVSSPSERYSDDQACSNMNNQSPEALSNEDVATEAKILSVKLSAALVSISEKEGLVKQHTKVAEEAVSGWERAENEVLSLKQQLEAAMQRNASLEGRALHLDGALKECVKQLRQTREEQEDKISTLKAELHCQSEHLKFVTIERDLSVEAAETASKQHLKSIKKSVRLEAECRRLKSASRKAYDQTSYAASSTYVDSLTDSQSDCGEILLESEKMTSSSPLRRSSMVEMNLMDDFLEMEKLVESPLTRGNPDTDLLTSRVTELEGYLGNVEGEKAKLESDLLECHGQLKFWQDTVRIMEVKVLDLQNELSWNGDVKCRMEEAQSLLQECRAENQSLSGRVSYLEDEVRREKMSSEDAWRKCNELEVELSRLKHDIASADDRLKAHQDEGLAASASKLELCQKTIASLGQKIKSLTMIEDSLVDTWDVNQPSDLHKLHPMGELVVSQ